MKKFQIKKLAIIGIIALFFVMVGASPALARGIGSFGW
jgi:hypothetical protein